MAKPGIYHHTILANHITGSIIVILIYNSTVFDTVLALINLEFR